MGPVESCNKLLLTHFVMTSQSRSAQSTTAEPLTIFCMHFFNLVDIEATFDDVVVQLIPTCRCRNLRARKAGKRREKEAV